MATVEPGARPASWRRVAAVAAFVRYMMMPVETTTAGRPGSKPAAKPLRPRLVRLEIHRNDVHLSIHCSDENGRLSNFNM